MKCFSQRVFSTVTVHLSQTAEENSIFTHQFTDKLKGFTTPSVVWLQSKTMAVESESVQEKAEELQETEDDFVTVENQAEEVDNQADAIEPSQSNSSESQGSENSSGMGSFVDAGFDIQSGADASARSLNTESSIVMVENAEESAPTVSEDAQGSSTVITASEEIETGGEASAEDVADEISKEDVLIDAVADLMKQVEQLKAEAGGLGVDHSVEEEAQEEADIKKSEESSSTSEEGFLVETQKEVKQQEEKNDEKDKSSSKSVDLNFWGEPKEADDAEVKEDPYTEEQSKEEEEIETVEEKQKDEETDNEKASNENINFWGEPTEVEPDEKQIENTASFKSAPRDGGRIPGAVSNDESISIEKSVSSVTSASQITHVRCNVTSTDGMKKKAASRPVTLVNSTSDISNDLEKSDSTLSSEKYLQEKERLRLRKIALQSVAASMSPPQLVSQAPPMTPVQEAQDNINKSSENEPNRTNSADHGYAGASKSTAQFDPYAVEEKEETFAASSEIEMKPMPVSSALPMQAHVDHVPVPPPISVPAVPPPIPAPATGVVTVDHSKTQNIGKFLT